MDLKKMKNKRFFTLGTVALVLLIVAFVAFACKLLFQTESTTDLAFAGTVLGLLVATAKYLISDYFGYKNQYTLKQEAKSSLKSIIVSLSSQDTTSKLSAAIMLRRFVRTRSSEGFSYYLKKETINVISSMLRVLPTGVFQKTLADGLAYAEDLSNIDLQRANLQDIYLGRKDDRPIVLNNTDLFLSDLSYSLLENVQGKAIFYRTILFCTQIKNCNFSEASFREADLTNARFKNVILENADFTDAVNIPDNIKKDLLNQDGKWIYPKPDPVFAEHSTLGKSIFFSMPSVMNKENELLTKDYQTYLERLGYRVYYYVKDDYPCYGQLNRIREKILASSAMVVFGLKQTMIHKATFRPNTEEEEEWNDRWLATPWNDIEIGMGVMKGMPILLVKDPQITLGVFDNNLSECFVASVSTNYDSRKLAQNTEIGKWLSKISL